MRGESAIEIQWNTFVRYSGATTRSNTTVLSHTCSIQTYVLLHMYKYIYTPTPKAVYDIDTYIHIYIYTYIQYAKPKVYINLKIPKA